MSISGSIGQKRGFQSISGNSNEYDELDSKRVRVDTIESSDQNIININRSLLDEPRINTGNTGFELQTINQSDLGMLKVKPNSVTGAQLFFHDGIRWKALNSSGAGGNDLWELNANNQIEPSSYPVTIDGVNGNQIVETNINKELISVAKMDAYNKNFGTTAGTVSQGDHTHSELHTHSNITNLNSINQDLATTSNVNFNTMNAFNVSLGGNTVASLAGDLHLTPTLKLMLNKDSEFVGGKKLKFRQDTGNETNYCIHWKTTTSNLRFVLDQNTVGRRFEFGHYNNNDENDTWNNHFYSVDNGCFNANICYQINGTTVLNTTTLGSGIVNSSLQSVGTLGSLNVSGTSTLNTINSNNIANAQAISSNDLTSNNIINSVGFQSGNIQILNTAALPSSGGASLILERNPLSPYASRFIFGDATGWKLPFSKRVGGITTDLFEMKDDGNFNISSGEILISAAQTGEKIVLYDVNPNFYGMGITGGQLNINSAASTVFYMGGRNGPDGTQKFKISDTYSQFNNNVLIGTGAQTNKLNIDPSATGEKIALFDFGTYYGMGVTGGQLNIHSPASILFYNGGRNGDGTEIARISSTGLRLTPLTADSYIKLNASKDIVVASNSSNLESINQNLSTTDQPTFAGYFVNGKKLEWNNIYDFNSYNQNKIVMHTGNTTYGYLNTCNAFDCFSMSFNYIQDSSLNPSSPYHYIPNAGYGTSKINLDASGVISFKSGTTNTVPTDVLTMGPGYINLPIHNASQILETDGSKNIISVSKNGAYNKNFGSIADTVFQGNDSRLHTHSNLSILDQVTQPIIDNSHVHANSNILDVTTSGSYAPTLTAGTNVSAVDYITNAAWKYTRVGNIVHVSGFAYITTVAFPNTQSAVYITYPVARFDNGSWFHCSGSAMTYTQLDQNKSPAVVWGYLQNECKMEFLSQTNTAQTWSINFTYNILPA